MKVKESEIIEETMKIIDKMKNEGYTLTDKYSSEGKFNELMEYLKEAEKEGIISEEEKKNLYCYYKAEK